MSNNIQNVSNSKYLEKLKVNMESIFGLLLDSDGDKENDALKNIEKELLNLEKIQEEEYIIRLNTLYSSLNQTLNLASIKKEKALANMANINNISTLASNLNPHLSHNNNVMFGSQSNNTNLSIKSGNINNANSTIEDNNLNSNNLNIDNKPNYDKTIQDTIAMLNRIKNLDISNK